jgi:hypothetical protein
VRVRILVIFGIAVSLAAAQSSAATLQGGAVSAQECGPWQDCRELALDARALEQYDRFYDLAWRAVQTGPPNDPALMYLLARAQALSGRPRDALVMLRRLAERGIPTDALTEADFERARRFPEWRDLEALLSPPAATAPSDPNPALTPAASPAATVAAAPSVAPAPAVTPVPAAAPVPTAPPVPAAPPVLTAAPPPAAIPPARAPSSVAPANPGAPSALKLDLHESEEVSRFRTAPFTASGLAYDAVSGRFLLGDELGRRVRVIAEGPDRSIDDLARAASARFHDVTAFAIDARRGDLWVASTASSGNAGALHRLQLISGRSVAMVESPSEFDKIRLVDLSVASNGTVLALDAMSSRIIGLTPDAKTLEQLSSLDVPSVTSITTLGDERFAYVAHLQGIARVDLQQNTVTAVTAADGIDLQGYERIRSHGNALIGVQRLQDGSRRIVRLELSRGRSVIEATVLDTSLGPGSRPPLVTVSGDDLYYVVVTGNQPADPGGARMDVVVRRIHLVSSSGGR